MLQLVLILFSLFSAAWWKVEYNNRPHNPNCPSYFVQLNKSFHEQWRGCSTSERISQLTRTVGAGVIFTGAGGAGGLALRRGFASGATEFLSAARSGGLRLPPY